jgi:excisionase family DNA binding protein
MQVQSTRLYRVRDVAEHFDVSVNTIYRAIESGQLTALKLGTGTGTFRVTGAAILAYTEACVRAAFECWFPGDGTPSRTPTTKWPRVVSQWWGCPGDRPAGLRGSGGAVGVHRLSAGVGAGSG